MARACLPPGFRFHPTDIELIMYYLKRKIMGKKFHFEAISELNIYKFSPWDLPDKSCLKSKDLNWYFFCPRERKYSSGDRMRRGTDTGYWKTTGKDRSIVYKERVVGMVKTLVFHEGCPPKGKRTDWVVYEYRMDDKDLADAGVSQDAYVLYKVFKKNGPGPRNGAQYGAPFNEEEWNDDDSGIPVDIPSDGPSPTVLTLPRNPNSVASKSVIDPVCPSASSLGEAGPSLVQPDPDDVILDGLSNSIVMDMFGPQCTPGWAFAKNGPFPAGPSVNDVPYSPNDDIAHLLVEFTGEGTGCPNEENYELDRLCHGRYNVVAPQLNGNDPFNGLEDLSRAELNVAHFPGGPGYIDKMLPQDDMEFLELNDLDAPLKFLEDFVGSEKICTGSSYEVSNADDLSKAGLNGVNFSGGSGYLNNMLPQDDMAFLELNDLDAPLNFPEDFVGSEKIFTGSSYEVSHADAPEHLTGISSTQFSYGAGSGEICYNNFPHSETELPGLSEFPLLPNSSGGHLDSTIVYPMENAYRSVLSQRFAAGYNLHSFSYGQPEESRGAAENQERGVLQRNFSSRLQQLLLESFPVHPASIVEYYLVPNSAYGDSSIHVKAEVTRSRFNACTKDALSVMLGESTYDYSCWWNLHGAEFWKKVAADCTSGYFLFHFGLILIM